jgi:Tfp pilus assembly protein PilF
LARAFLQLGLPKEARKQAEEAVAQGPRVALAHLSLGLVAMRQKDPPKAREALEKAVELDPTNGEIYLALGDALVKEDPQAAVTRYETFLKMGGEPADQSRVRKSLEALRKKLAK